MVVMAVKKVKKKLSLNKLTIQDLDHIRVTILESNEQDVVRAGSGITKSPKYCLS